MFYNFIVMRCIQFIYQKHLSCSCVVSNIFLKQFQLINYPTPHELAVNVDYAGTYDFLLAYCGTRVNKKYFILHNICSSLIMSLINYNVKNLFKKKISSCSDPRTLTKYAVEEKLVQAIFLLIPIWDQNQLLCKHYFLES